MRGLEAPERERKALAKQKLTTRVRVLKEQSHPAGIDWNLINWRFRTVQGLLEFIGAYPDVARRRGLVEIRRLSEIDLIPAGFSDKSSDFPDRSSDSPSSKQEAWARKLERAKKRLEKLASCGKNGHLLLVIEKKNGKEISRKLRYHPHRCHSVLCPYCSFENFRQTFAKYIEVFEEWCKANKRLAFWTLTLRSFSSPVEAVEFAFKALEKLYQFRLGKRNWGKIRKEFAKEVLSYYRALKGVDKEARQKVLKQIRYFREFEARIQESSGVKFGQLFNAVWKFEITYTERGWHPHWHGIVDAYIPKLLLTVLWRIASEGLGEITDVRRVAKGRKGLLELTKYITKHWELEGVEFEKLVELEAALLGRKKFRVWGFEVLEFEEDEEVEYVAFWMIRCELKYRKNLHQVSRLIRRMRRAGVKKARIDRIVIYDERQGVFECDLWLFDDGSLVVLDEHVVNMFVSYADYIQLFGGLKEIEF